MQKQKYYRCPVCKNAKTKYKSLKLWGNHMMTYHKDQIPPGYSIERYFYFLQTGKTHTNCVVCKQPTSWNQVSLKYNRYCDNPECKKSYSKEMKQRMKNVYGVEHKLDQPAEQRKLLRAKKTSGVYKFHDGSLIEYASSYELDFLKMLDNFIKLPGVDIIGPSPNTYYYDYKNKDDAGNEGRKFYIPDFYIPSINLEIEIKQQTSTHHAMNKISRVKETLKDDMMKNIKGVNYIKINDKDYTGFFDFLQDYQERVIETLIKIGEQK